MSRDYSVHWLVGIFSLLLHCIPCDGSGSFVRTCIFADSVGVTLADGVSGSFMNATISVSKASGNIGCAAFDNGNMYLGLTTSNNNGGVYMLQYDSKSITYVKQCPFPGSTIACVASFGGDTFVLHYTSGLAPQISKLNMESCNFTAIATAAGRVKGSINGPGGECVILPSLNSLFFMTEDNSSLAYYNYVTNTSGIAISYPNFTDSFYGLMVDPVNNYFIYNGAMRGAAYKITTNPYQVSELFIDPKIYFGLYLFPQSPAPLLVEIYGGSVASFFNFQGGVVASSAQAVPNGCDVLNYGDYSWFDTFEPNLCIGTGCSESIPYSSSTGTGVVLATEDTGVIFTGVDTGEIQPNLSAKLEPCGIILVALLYFKLM